MKTPHELAEERYQLSVEYGRISDRLAELSQGRAVKWLKMRQVASSAREADLLWEATPEGQEELVLRYKAKGIEKRISGLSTLLRVLENEARNTY